MISTSRILLVFLFFPLFLSSKALADGSCTIAVRSIAGAKEGDAQGASELIPELEQQLGTLPFKRYRIVESVKSKLIGKEELLLSLAGCTGAKHKLKIRPERRTNHGVIFTFDWNNPQGMSLLSTRLNLVNGRTVFVGTEETQQESTVLAIRLNCESIK